MSSGSLKGTVKALNDVFSGAAVEVRLSEELQEEIGAFLDKHQDIDDSNSQRIQDALLNVHEKYVAKEPDKWAAFLRVLTQLRPAIIGQVRHERWWTLLIKPVLDDIGNKRSTIEAAKGLLLSFLVYDSADDKGGAKARLSRHFTKEALGIYLNRTRTVGKDEQVVVGEDEFIAEQLETVLVTFGQSKPKDFLVATDRLFTAVQHRVQALSLLCAFLRFQPPHLHMVSETPLIEHLLQCLMNDTSTTAIQLALTVLTMLLPHIPSSLASHLPRLYLIYSRILCWERFGPASSEKRGSEVMEESHTFGNTRAANIDLEWTPLHHTFDEIEPTTPELLHYFTFMYGLYPLNFMSYIRKPRKYLQNIGFPGADEFDLNQAAIRKRTEQFQQVHILHPNFFNTTIEEELTDNRWVKSDPAEVVAECMGLCVTTPTTLDEPGPAPTGRLPEIPERYVRTEHIPPQSLTGNEDDNSVTASGLISPSVSKPFSSWRDTQTTARSASTSSRPRDSSSVFDSPTLPPQSADRTDHGSRVQTASTKDPRSDRIGSVASMPSVDMLSPRLSVYAQNSGPPKILYPSAGAETSRTQTKIAYLQREIILLRNNLNFERWQTKQHLVHIGQRQRKHINEAAVEAEIQDLRSTIRSLKAKLAKGKEAYAMLKKETIAARNNFKRSEAEQSSKLQELREAQKQWKAEEEKLAQELRKVKKDCDHLRRLLVQSEAKEILSQQTLETMKFDMQDLEMLRDKVQELESKLGDYLLKELDFEQVKEEEQILRTELETARLKLQSSHAERERIKKAMERKMADLASQLQTVQGSKSQHGRVPSDVQAMLDQALAASHSKVAQLKKAYDRLNHKYGELKLRCQELETEREDGYRSPPYSRRPSRGDPNSIPEEGFPFPTPPTGTFNGIMGGTRLAAAFALSVPATYEEHMGEIENESYLLSPNMTRPSASYPGRPVRYDTMHRRGPEPLTPSTERSGMVRSPSSTKTTRSVLSEGLFSSNQSKVSLETRGTATSDKSKGKIEPKSDVRVYGRGGAQNIKMKEKEKKDKDKTKSLRSGGLFGNRGIS